MFIKVIEKQNKNISIIGCVTLFTWLSIMKPTKSIGNAYLKAVIDNLIKYIVLSTFKILLILYGIYKTVTTLLKTVPNTTPISPSDLIRISVKIMFENASKKETDVKPDKSEEA